MKKFYRRLFMKWFIWSSLTSAIRSRSGYHNKEWGTLMKRVGLYPSNTGQPGGKETGQSVSHYIIDGGPFSIACRALIETGFMIEYADIWRDGEKKESEKNKAKYTCEGCGFNAWAKPNGNLICGDCSQQMLCVTSMKEAA